jgi:N-methylhydantoinase B/acetone carboxylase, alpha subunit
MTNRFTLEVISNALINAAEEMFYAFGRTAKSPVIYEVLDYAVGLTDSQGKLIAQAPGVPGFSGVLDFVALEVLQKFRDLQPGDLVISNVPYGSGTHLNDVALTAPVFVKDRLLGLVVNKGHWSEVGGMHFGSWTSDATEIFQEGLQLPAVLLYKEGKINKDLMEVIRYNSRLPDAILGDMEAQVASMGVAARRLTSLVEKYGEETVREAMEKILRDGETRSLRAINSLPKGEFKAEDYIDDDGVSEEPVKVVVKVNITDSSFTADFTGSSKQVKGPINSPFPATVSAVREVFMAAVDPHAEPNAGFFSPLNVIAPLGSIFNPVRPAPTSTYWESMSYATDLVWKALAPQLKGRLPAGHFLSILATILGGVDDRTGEPYAIVEPQPGGWGASSFQDGESALVASGDGETYMASAEVYERRMPIMVESCELNIEDGSGAGEFRGGFGVIRKYKVLSREAYFTVSIGRSKFPTWGVENGEGGTPNYCVVERDGKTERVRKVAAMRLNRGDSVTLRSGGGGGWGDPRTRDPLKVLQDVLNGYISKAIAKEKYGVVIEGDSVNWTETAKLRGGLK